MIGIRDLIDIVIVWLLFYWAYSYLRGTRALQVLKGFVVLLLVSVLSQVLGLNTLNWILRTVWAAWAIAILILFQPELRRLLAQLGQFHLSKFHHAGYISFNSLKEITRAVSVFQREAIGALIVFERRASVEDLASAGLRLDARISYEILYSIFHPSSPLHDGAVLIKEDRIVMASAILPLSSKSTQGHGTRHRAALGITEETDALAVVVSETSREISVAVSGELRKLKGTDELETILKTYLMVGSNE